MRETHGRSIVKGLSWRFFATIDTIILAYLFTGSISLAASIGGVEVATKVALYFLHERLWLNIGWGDGEAAAEPHNLRTAVDRALLYALLCILFLVVMGAIAHALR